MLLAVSYSERMMNSDNNNKRQIEGQRRAAPRKRVASERSVGERQGAACRGDMGQCSRAGRQEGAPPRPSSDCAADSGRRHARRQETPVGPASNSVRSSRRDTARPSDFASTASAPACSAAPRDAACASGRPAAPTPSRSGARSMARPSEPASGASRPAPRLSASAAPTRSSARPSAPASGALRSAERPSARPSARPFSLASASARSARSISAVPALFDIDLRIVGAVLLILVVATILVVRGCSDSEPSSAASAPAASATPVAEESQVDMTTDGFGDSEQALAYTEPRKAE